MDVLTLLRFVMVLWVWLAALWLTQDPASGACAPGLTPGALDGAADPVGLGPAAVVWLVALAAQIGILVALRPSTGGTRRHLPILLAAGAGALGLWAAFAPLSC